MTRTFEGLAKGWRRTSEILPEVNANLSSSMNFYTAYLSSSKQLSEFDQPTLKVESSEFDDYVPDMEGEAVIYDNGDNIIFRLVYADSSDMPGLAPGELPEAVIEDPGMRIESGQQILYNVWPEKLQVNNPDPSEITSTGNDIVEEFFSD